MNISLAFSLSAGGCLSKKRADQSAQETVDETMEDVQSVDEVSDGRQEEEATGPCYLALLPPEVKVKIALLARTNDMRERQRIKNERFYIDRHGDITYKDPETLKERMILPAEKKWWVGGDRGDSQFADLAIKRNSLVVLKRFRDHVQPFNPLPPYRNYSLLRATGENATSLVVVSRVGWMARDVDGEIRSFDISKDGQTVFLLQHKLDEPPCLMRWKKSRDRSKSNKDHRRLQHNSWQLETFSLKDEEEDYQAIEFFEEFDAVALLSAHDRLRLVSPEKAKFLSLPGIINDYVEQGNAEDHQPVNPLDRYLHNKGVCRSLASSLPPASASLDDAH